MLSVGKKMGVGHTSELAVFQMGTWESSALMDLVGYLLNLISLLRAIHSIISSLPNGPL